jgi:hypothetical protein
VSNYNFESLKGFEEEILVAAEVINGTGDVKLVVSPPGTGGEESVIVHFTPDQALAFARLVSQQAHEAMRAKWDEDNLSHG